MCRGKRTGGHGNYSGLHRAVFGNADECIGVAQLANLLGSSMIFFYNNSLPAFWQNTELQQILPYDGKNG
jgi:hypothetical protein